MTDPTPPAKAPRVERPPWPPVAKFSAAALALFAVAGASAVAVLKSDSSTPPVLVEKNARAKDLAATHRQQLTEYGWVDQEKGLIRIPIERAMQLVAEGKR